MILHRIVRQGHAVKMKMVDAVEWRFVEAESAYKVLN